MKQTRTTVNEMEMEILGPNLISQGENQTRYCNSVPVFSLQTCERTNKYDLKLLLWNENNNTSVMQMHSLAYSLVTIIYQKLKIDMCKLVPRYLRSGPDGGDI